MRELGQERCRVRWRTPRCHRVQLRASEPSASATPVSGRSPASFSQTSARSISRRDRTLDSGGRGVEDGGHESATVVWPDATRASRTESSRRVSRSRARFSDDLVAAREASWPQSAGAGVARSGRSAGAGRVSRSSGQPRSWSASERCPVPGPGRACPGADEVPIVPTLAVGPRPSTRCATPMDDQPAVSTQVGLRYGAATDVGLLREVNEDSFLADPRCSWSPTAWAATTAATSPAGSWSRSSPGSPTTATTPARACRPSSRDARRCPASAARVRRHPPRPRRRTLARRHDRGRRPARRGREGPRWLLANLGDSRIYALTDGGLVRVSTDHSVVQELVDAGMITEEEAAWSIPSGTS